MIKFYVKVFEQPRLQNALMNSIDRLTLDTHPKFCSVQAPTASVTEVKVKDTDLIFFVSWIPK